MKKTPEVLRYAKSRGLTKEMLLEYKIGAFPQNIEVLKQHVDEEFLSKKCILKSPYHSDFKDFNSFIIPIIDEYGDAVGIAGRSLLPADQIKAIGVPKYKNSSFKKSNHLFGINLAYESILKNDRVFIVEGYLDQMAMHKNGIENTVAMGGTAFSKGHLLKLLRLTTNLFFIFDRDDAGLLSASRIKKRFGDDFININFLRGPKGVKDVDEFFSSKEKSDFFKEFKRFSPEDEM